MVVGDGWLLVLGTIDSSRRHDECTTRIIDDDRYISSLANYMLILQGVV